MKMLQSSFTRVLTASARSCWSGKFAQSDAGQPPTFPPRRTAKPPPRFSPDFPRYLQQLHASVNTYLAIQVGNPKDAGDAMLVFLSFSWPKHTFLWLWHKSQKAPNVICLLCLFFLCAINPFSFFFFVFPLWDNKLLSQKAFNGLATKFRNFFAICRLEMNLMRVAKLLSKVFVWP